MVQPAVDLVAEAMIRAFADRAKHLDNPGFNLDLPVERRTFKAFAKMRFDQIDMSKGSPSDTYRFGQIHDGSSIMHLSVAEKKATPYWEMAFN